MYCRDMTLSVKMLANLLQRTYSEVQEYVADMNIQLQIAFNRVRNNFKKAHDKKIVVRDIVFAHFPNMAKIFSK